MRLWLQQNLGLHNDQVNSLFLAIFIIGLIVIPQWLWSGEVDPVLLAQATARKKQRDKALAERIRKVVNKSAAAFGQKSNKQD